jgi:hypothetical protein
MTLPIHPASDNPSGNFALDLFFNQEVTGHALVEPLLFYGRQISNLFLQLPVDEKMAEVAKRVFIAIVAVTLLPLVVSVAVPLSLVGFTIKFFSYLSGNMPSSTPEAEKEKEPLLKDKKAEPNPPQNQDSPKGADKSNKGNGSPTNAGKGKIDTNNGPKVDTTPPIFYKAAEQWAFLEGVLEKYRNLIFSDDPSWHTPPASASLYILLTNLQDEMNKLADSAREMVNLQNRKLRSDDISVEDLEQLELMVKKADGLKAQYIRMLASVKPHLPPGSPKGDNQVKKPKGISNSGNTCYINSALQPLLAINNFANLIPREIKQNADESDQAFKGRQKIFKAFIELISGWQNNNDPHLLGQLVAQLRIEIFLAQLPEGGFINFQDLGGMQDAGSFIQLILHVIGKRFELSLKKTFAPKNGESKETLERSMEGLYILKQTTGAMQDKISSSAKPFEGELDAPVRGTELKKYVETSKILGKPPELLVFRVENHLVDAVVDKQIDCGQLFEQQFQPGECRYELVGFARNHHQIHWTSVVFSDGKWQYCNDSVVREIEPSDPNFSYPANYLVYKKI